MQDISTPRPTPPETPFDRVVWRIVVNTVHGALLAFASFALFMASWCKVGRGRSASLVCEWGASIGGILAIGGALMIGLLLIDLFTGALPRKLKTWVTAVIVAAAALLYAGLWITGEA